MLILKLILLMSVSATVAAESLLQSFNLNVILNGLENVNLSTSSCGLALHEYFQSLGSGQRWAQTMYDSSAHTLHGVYYGNNQFIGHFDECLSVKHPENLFEGKHCVLNLELYDKEVASLAAVNYGQLEAFLRRKPKLKELSRFYPALFAVCVPSTCSAKEIEEALEEWFNKKTDEASHIIINLEEDNCYTNEVSKKESNWLIVCCVIVICILTLSSTVYDIVQRLYYNVDRPHKLLISFSIYTNLPLIVGNDEDGKVLKAVNGLRAAYSFLLLFLHIYIFGLWFGPAENLKDFEKGLKEFQHVDFNHLTDAFFFIGGFVVAYNFSRRLKRVGYYDFPLSLIDRYLRISPVLVVVRLFSSWVFLRLARGPLWNYSNKNLFESCQQGWITALLYSWNYLDPMQPCMICGWYLNVDMQLFFLSPLILIPVLYYPAWAKVYLPALISIATYISFAVNYSHGFLPHLGHMDERWAAEYIATHTRAVPWLIGIFFGYTFYATHGKKINIRLSKFKILLGWIISVLLLWTTMFGTYFLGQEEHCSRFQGALFISLARVFFPSALAWIIFACENGFGGPVYAILASRSFQLISNISYGIYIVQSLVLSFIAGSRKTNYIAGPMELINVFSSTILLTVIFALLVTVLIDIPARNIRGYFFQKMKIWPIYKLEENKLQEKEE